MPANISQDSLSAVLIADDHLIVRTGLQMVLELNFGITDISEAASCADVMSSLRRRQPSHLIIDMVFKDGNAMEIIPSIRNLYPELSVMVYSMMPRDIYLPALEPYNVRHYASKDSSQEQFISILGTFISGRTRTADERTEPKTASPFDRLSPRELEVLHYLLAGRSVTEITELLNLHKNTVSTLKSRLMAKADAENFTELLDKARIHGLKF